MYTSLAQPCKGVNINTNGGDKSCSNNGVLYNQLIPIQDQHQFKSHQYMNIDIGGGDKLFAQWSVVKPSNFLMNHDQHQFMNHQGVNTDTCDGDRLFAQQSVVEPFDFSMTQYWHHNQHQFMSNQDVNINTSSAHELFPQQNDPMDALMIQDQRYDQHQLMSDQGINTDANCGDRLFPQQSIVKPSYFSMTQGTPTDALMTQDQHHDQHQFMSHQGVNTNTYSGDDNFFSELSIEELREFFDILGSSTRISCRPNVT
ncbi:hypothetical protein R3W88_019402 [Solanum pinnatisectum]|uniref:Uncharacterized protein n=1 Tax=Solanum pinnatisectum TaxID=50273 RepID=A0AAV9KM67_9SOLN|nr:hypothetical protein R3W88_019402 [Solanum pinnatisectum]